VTQFDAKIIRMLLFDFDVQ